MSKINKELINQVYDEIVQTKPMTGREFKQWLDELGLTQKQAADMIGRGSRQVRIYLKEEDKQLPLYIHLTCSFILMRVRMKERLSERGK